MRGGADWHHRVRHCIMKLLDALLRAAPPGPVAVTVVKNSWFFGSVPKNVCWSTVMLVVVDAGFPRLDVLYGCPVDVLAPGNQTSRVYALTVSRPSESVFRWSADVNVTLRPITKRLALLTVTLTSAETFAFPAKSRATAVSRQAPLLAVLVSHTVV